MNYFLWFLFFLSIPILVHLFSFRRAKKLFFTNVRFIKLVSTETKSKTRLKQLLVLSSRILAFIFLILAFITSFVRFDDDGISTDRSIGLVYLDNSRSTVGADVSDEAGLVESLYMGTQAQKGRFLTNDFVSFSSQERDQSEILEELQNLQVSYVSRTFPEILSRFYESRNVYFISDFEETTLEDLGKVSEDSLREYHLLVKKQVGIRNVFVDSVWVEKDLDNYHNSILKCIVGKTENFSDASVVVKLLDSSGKQVASIVKSLQSDPLISFTLPPPSGNAEYRIQLSGDDVDYDNDFYFVLNQRPKPRILLLNGSKNSYLEQIFGNDELFELIIARPEDLDYEQLKGINLIVLNDFDQFPKGLVRQGLLESSVFVFPSDSVDTENYSSEGPFSITYDSNSEPHQMQLEEGNLLMAGAYKQTGQEILLPSSTRKYAIRSTHERLLTLRDGSTFFGKAVDDPFYFLLSPLRDEYTELPKHSIFLPMMYRVAEESVNMDNNLFSYPGNYLEVDGFSADVPPKIISEGLELIPEFVLQNQKGLVKIPSELAPGFYHILQQNDTVKSFGVNIPKMESTFDGPSFDEIDNFFSETEHVRVTRVFDDYESSTLTGQENNHLWKYALILAVMFLLVETAFHRYLK